MLSPGSEEVHPCDEQAGDKFSCSLFNKARNGQECRFAVGFSPVWI